VRQASLKWPNDLMVDGAKLGGILVETRAEGSATRAVIGIGVNYRREPGLEKRLRRQIAALEDFATAPRNRVIQQIGIALLAALGRFEEAGFGAVRPEWEMMDANAGQRLRVRLADGRSISGIGGGIGADGSLRLLTRQGERNVRSGRILSAKPA
jgi:BirA family transcriptional regulator, biotin operon repressor / biotin---[acetyl-CoA-carboxylase] ligase